MPPSGEPWEEYSEHMEAELTERRRLKLGLTGELMTYTVDRDQLRALDSLPDWPPPIAPREASNGQALEWWRVT
jgi:hypothetical protein